MGWSAARKLRRAVDGLTRVVAIELLTAARALDLQRPARACAGHRRRPGDRLRTVIAGPRTGPLARPGDRGRGAAGGRRKLGHRRRGRHRPPQLTHPSTVL